MSDELIKVFYSWQSDLPRESNQDAIRNALKNIANTLEIELAVKIELNEATSNLVGSPHIPRAILNKVSNADIFICDISTINSNETGRKIANPNVLIELGIAIALLGWDRIILLANRFFTNFPNDLPFDIDRHRALAFKIIDGKDKNGKDDLTNRLAIAIKNICKANPSKPYLLNVEAINIEKREKDLNTIYNIMCNVDLDAFEVFFSNFPAEIRNEILYYSDVLMDTIKSNHFYLYDKEINKIITDFIQELHELASESTYYWPISGTKNFKFTFPNDNIEANIKSRKNFHMLRNRSLNLSLKFKALLDYIRENYIEIEIEKTTRKAKENFIAS